MAQPLQQHGLELAKVAFLQPVSPLERGHGHPPSNWIHTWPHHFVHLFQVEDLKISHIKKMEGVASTLPQVRASLEPSSGGDAKGARKVPSKCPPHS